MKRHGLNYLNYLETLVLSLIKEREDNGDYDLIGGVYSPYNVKEAITQAKENSEVTVKLDKKITAGNVKYYAIVDPLYIEIDVTDDFLDIMSYYDKIHVQQMVELRKSFGEKLTRYEQILDICANDLVP